MGALGCACEVWLRAYGSGLVRALGVSSQGFGVAALSVRLAVLWFGRARQQVKPTTTYPQAYIEILQPSDP